MSSIKVVTDSTADLSSEQVNKYGIEVVPITVSFGQDSYADGIDLSAEEFFTRLTSGKELPKTSQPSPEAFRQAYEKIAGENDVILSVHISGKLSGTLNSVEVASKEVKPKVIPIDTKTASQGIGLSVLIAAEAADRDLPVEKAVEITEKSIANTFSVFAVDTLNFYSETGGLEKPRRF